MPLLANVGFRKYRSALGGNYPTTTGVNVGSYLEDTDTGLVYQYLPVSASSYRWFPVQAPWISFAGAIDNGDCNNTAYTRLLEIDAHSNATFPLTLVTLNTSQFVTHASVVCTEVFNSNSILYSIGDDSDHDRYVKQFAAPTTLGAVRGITGVSLEGNFDVGSLPTGVVKIYASGANTYGCFSIRLGLHYYNTTQFDAAYGPLFFTQSGGTDSVGITNKVTAVNLTTAAQNASGTLSQTLRNHAGCGRGQMAFVAGGHNGTSLQTEIRYFHCLYALDTVTDKGDLAAAREGLSAVSHPSASTVMFAGGWNGVALSNIIEYVAPTQVVGNASDKGDLVTAITNLTGVTNGKFAFFGGGQTGPVSTEIQRVDMTTGAQNAVVTGDLTIARHSMGGMSGLTYGVFAGGHTGATESNVMDNILLTIAYTNATDKGDLVAAAYQLAGASDLSNDTGYVSGGYAGGSLKTTISEVDLSIGVGNASAFGTVDGRRGHSAAI